MKAFLKSVLLNNVQLKLFSLVLGYIGWSIISQSHTDDVWIEVPICFSQTQQVARIKSPETVKVNLSGKRSDLRSLDTKTTAVHIDTRDLKNGEQNVALSEHQLLLPETVRVTGWAPTHVRVNVEKNSNS